MSLSKKNKKRIKKALLAACKKNPKYLWLRMAA